VEQEASDKFKNRQGHRLDSVVITPIAIAKEDLIVFEPDDAVVG